MEETLDNFSDSNGYLSRNLFTKAPAKVEENYYSTHQSLDKDSKSNTNTFFYIVLFLIVVSGIILAEKKKVFSKYFTPSTGEIILQNGYVMTSINHKFPILINKNDLRIKEELSQKSTVTSLFDDVASNLCMKGETVAEVGAHYGYNVIMLGQILKDEGKYIAIEANPSVAKCLRKNLMLNDLSDKVEIIEKAASAQKGRGFMENIVSLVQNEQGLDKVITDTVSVECETLNEMLKNKGVSLILIGVPNAAFEVLKGADRIIDESDNIRVLAHLDMEKVDKSINVQESLNFLVEHGMTFHEVISENSIKRISVDEIFDKKEFVVLMKKDR